MIEMEYMKNKNLNRKLIWKNLNNFSRKKSSMSSSTNKIKMTRLNRKKHKKEMNNNLRKMFQKEIKIFIKSINSIWGDKRKESMNGRMMKTQNSP